MNPLISIVIPVYNVEKYLEHCLSSIRNQSYENIEVIIINDGSTDDSDNIIDKFVTQDKRFNKIIQKNRGVGAARNKGIEFCKGQYIAFIDSDDYIHKDFIKELYGNINANDSDIAICDYYGVFDEGNSIKYQKDWIINDSVVNSKEAIISLFFLNNMSIVPWNKLYKKRLFEGNNNPFPLGVKNEDVEGIFRIFYRANKVSYVNQAFYYYLQRENSETKTYDKSIFDMFKVLDNIIEFLENKHEFHKYREEFNYLFFYFGIIITFKRAMNLSSNEIKESTQKIQSKLQTHNIKEIISNKHLKIRQKLMLLMISKNLSCARLLFKYLRR